MGSISSSSITSIFVSIKRENSSSQDRKYSYLKFLFRIKSRTIADTYPNEILPGRLWLGDWHHAKDEQVIDVLQITHILNISDSCENYLEESHRKLDSFGLIGLPQLI